MSLKNLQHLDYASLVILAKRGDISAKRLIAKRALSAIVAECQGQTVNDCLASLLLWKSKPENRLAF